MTKWNLIFDADRCNNCNNCILATKDEYVGNAFPGYSAPMPAQGTLWLTVKRHERGTAPMIDVSHYVETCMNCRNPDCVNDKTVGIVTQRDDGIVLIDPDKAKGRRDIVSMCPHGQIFWNEELELPQKWTFDAHLLDGGWKEPRATQVCPTSALTAVKADDGDMQQRVESGELSALEPEAATGPRFYVKNFDRIRTCFLGGSVYAERDGTEDCLEGIAVSLTKEGSVIAKTVTDTFGEFKFDGLSGQGEELTVEVVPSDGVPVRRQVSLQSSQYLGAILVPA